MNKFRKFYYWLGALLILASTRPAVAIDTVPLSERGRHYSTSSSNFIVARRLGDHRERRRRMAS